VLQSIELHNFRRFESHVVRFRPTTIIVGANAGKSTIVEAIRLVPVVANRHRSLNFGPPPEWVNDPTAGVGVSPSL
jgi:AAA15 family ATPase/GTPase